MDKDRVGASLDVHKDSVYLCIMEESGQIILEKYGTLIPELRQKRDEMVMYGVSETTMESTGVYWIPVWNELFGHMDLKFVNPFFIKQLPGRKSDIKDALELVKIRS